MSKETYIHQKETYKGNLHTSKRDPQKKSDLFGWGLNNRGRWRRYDTDVKSDLHTSKETHKKRKSNF